MGPSRLGTLIIDYFTVEFRIELFKLTGVSQYPRGMMGKAHIVIVLTPHVMCEFMAQHSPDIIVGPKPVVEICSNPQLDLLAGIHIQTQQLRMFMGCQFRQ